MKVQVIKTKDQNEYTSLLQDMYENKIVTRVEVSTEVAQGNIYFIAIVFYRDHIKEVKATDEVKGSTPLDEICELPVRIGNAIRIYNNRVDDCHSGRKPLYGNYNKKFYDKHIKTVDDLVEMIRSKKIYRLRGIGAGTVDAAKKVLDELGYIEEA